jgi:hypothetical protein
MSKILASELRKLEHSPYGLHLPLVPSFSLATSRRKEKRCLSLIRLT